MPLDMRRLAVLVRLPVLTAALWLAGCGERAPELDADDIERNNRGVALMGQYRNDEAEAVFAELAAEHPGWLDVRVNRAIATKNRQNEGDERRALAILEPVLAADPGHPRARYVTGLLHFYLGETEQALSFLEPLAEQRPDNAHLAYFTGQSLAQLDRPEQALAAYRRAIDADPYLRSAYYGAAQILRRLGRREDARKMLADYQRLADNPRAHLAEFRYTRMGPLAEARAVDRSAPAGPRPKPEGDLFAPSRTLAEWPRASAGSLSSLTAADIDDDGDIDLFAADPSGSRVFLRSADGFEVADDHPLAGIDDVAAAAWGDVDNDGALEVYLCRHGANALHSAATGWQPVSVDEPLSDPGQCVDSVLVDADHDGDLDVYVVNADGASTLYNNDLDGSWRNLAEGRDDAPAMGEGGRQVLVTDLDADRDADIVLVGQGAPNRVWLNDRLWRYRPHKGMDAFRSTDLRAVSAGDFDADGHIDLVSVDADGRLALWRPDADGNWAASALGRLALPDDGAVDLAVLDLDGDGRPEILAHHGRGFEVHALTRDGASTRRLVQVDAELTALAPVLMDAGRGPALIGVSGHDGGARLQAWPAGRGRHAFAALAPSGRSERADGMRSNASGIGTGIVARIGERWVVTDTHDRHSAPGQSLQPLSLGLGGHGDIDFVRLHWSDGVLQTEMALAAGETHRIVETQRQLASCPVLFAWNGERYGFVSDLLGVAGIGFLHAPGQYSEPRPWEFFRFPAGSIAPRDGRYRIKIAEPMEESAYLDSARLHVYDLPPDWSLALDERMHTGGGPAPTGRPVFYRDDELIEIARATNERGQEVTDALAAVDARAAPVGEIDRRFLGRLADTHVLTLDFDTVINPPGARPVLLIDGWVEYPYSQTVFAAWQAQADYRSPSLEAYADGRWHSVFEHFGYPAGMPREASLPLASLPPRTTALRLSTNLQIYYDRLAVIHARPMPDDAQVARLPVAAARVAKTGFAERSTGAQRRPHYDYDRRAPFWDTKYQTGFYTALGPVTPLVAEHDQAFAIIGPGEEVDFEFEAPSAPASGRVRHVVLEVRGYAKDMDLYTRDGETVGPMPGSESDRRAELHERYQTRFQGGF